jgi:hypothetical protein
VAELNHKDWSFLDENFQRYGQWRSGLAGVKDQFEIKAQSRWGKYILDLTLKAPPKMTWRLKVRKKNGGIQGEAPSLPDGPELDFAALKKVDEILAEYGDLYLVEPLNSRVELKDPQGGIEVLRSGSRPPTTRHLGPWAVFYFHPSEPWETWRLIWFNLDENILGGIADHDGPNNSDGQIRLLKEEEVLFIDAAMKTHGDFGVYGNVTSGLRDLVENMDVKLKESKEQWSVNATPRDYHGHFLGFEIKKPDGVIQGCRAGHLEPPPRII